MNEKIKMLSLIFLEVFENVVLLFCPDDAGITKVVIRIMPEGRWWLLFLT
jgi:hypothetical protein